MTDQKPSAGKRETPAKHSAPKKADAKKADKKPDAPKKLWLSELCHELGKDPKAVRARFRRMYRTDDPDPTLPKLTDDKRWGFDPSDRDALIALIDNESASAAA